MAKKQTVELQFLTNAKMMLGELRAIRVELLNIRLAQQQMNATSVKAVTSTRSHTSAMKNQSSSMKGLALRFVGYNLVLNQVMGAQQKLIEFIRESVTAYREFETRIAEISTILGSEHLPLLFQLESGIENLSMAYGQATSDMSKGMYDILSAAFNAEDALNLLTTATKASIAGLSDIRTSVDIFTTVLNTYGLQVEQATHVSNVLFQSVIRGKFQFQDLEQALGYVVPIAAQAGIQFQELMAALSTATRHGLHLDMTSRGLALAIQGIVNPSTKATKAAAKYGIEMNGLALRVMGLYGWFEKLNEATKEYGKSILGELIPNMRSLRVAMVLAGDVGLAGFNEDLQELAKMGNATEVALKKIMNTSGFTANQLTQQWEKVKRDVGEDWDELFLNIQRGILGIVDFFASAKYISTAGGEFEFIKDDTIHNAMEYLRILNKIETLEEEKADLPPDPEQPNWFKKWSPIHTFLGGVDELVRMVTGGVKESTETPIADLETDIIDLIKTQEPFTDAINEVVGGILTGIDTLGNLELTLSSVELAVRELEDALLKTFSYGFKNADGIMKEASVTIDSLTTLTNEQREALKKLGDTVKGNLAYQYMALHAQRTYADATHDVSIGLKMEGYLYKEIPADIEKAVNAVRNYTEAQKASREATQRMTAAMRKYQIQLLELQLKGMMRRRGLTRSEEKQIKKIQIAQAKARLENMKGQKKVSEADVITNQTSQALIDDYLLKIKEKQYELKYTYDQQIIDLETAISREGEKLQTRYDWWKTTNQKIITNSTDLIATLNALMDEPLFIEMLADYGLKVDDLKAKIKALQEVAEGRADTYVAPKAKTVPGWIPPKEVIEGAKSSFEAAKEFVAPKKKRFSAAQEATGKMFSRLPPLIEEALRSRMPSFVDIPQYDKGIDFVPETQIAMVHKGERITSAGENSRGSIQIDNLTIAVKEIAELNDIEKLGAILSAAKNSRVLTNKGNTRYRSR